MGDPPLNYLESPEIVQHPDGSWTLLAHGGNCCVAGSGAFEAIFAIRYYTHATPQWQMIRSSADQADGHEYGGATALRLRNGEWIMGQASTHKSDWGKPNRLRGGMGWARDLWGPWRWEDLIYGPIDPACAVIGSCVGIGAPQTASIVWLPYQKQLWLYGQDSTRKPPMRIIRYPLDPNTGNRIGPPEHTVWPQVVTQAATAGQASAAAARIRLGGLHPLEARLEGGTAMATTATENDPNVTDIGLGTDGCLWALASDRGTATANSYYSGVRSYRSCPTATELAGRVWELLDWPAWQPPVGVAWDAGWIRDERGVIVEPRGIVAVWSSPPAHFANEHDGWWLIVRTESGAYRPATLGQTPIHREP
ncbi:MAG: hypothetical protein HY825_13655 [Acidobacteria bacterium]|nr:hypothetical protein [Acidobacteriota bacterium]